MSDIPLPEGSIEVSRITIVKTFDDDAQGGAAVFVHYGEDLSLIDALGMLAFAQATTLDTFTRDDGL